MFGIDVYRSDLTRLVAGEEEDAPRLFGETLEHTELNVAVRRTLPPRASVRSRGQLVYFRCRGCCRLQDGPILADMGTTSRFLGALAAACLLTTACDAINKLTGKNPTSPSGTSASLGDFAGTWVTSASTLPATSCGDVKYTVTPVSETSANVTFSGTCAGNTQVNGSGTGTVSGSTLGWNAQGTVTQGSLTCPFTFTNGKATPEATGGIRVVYSGTVCGIPVSGDEVLKKS